MKNRYDEALRTNSPQLYSVLTRKSKVRSNFHWGNWAAMVVFLVAMAFLLYALSGSLSVPTYDGSPTTYFQPNDHTGPVTTPDFSSEPTTSLLY